MTKKDSNEAKRLAAIKLNKRQAEFYNSISLKEDEEAFTGYRRNKNANIITKLWAKLRYAQQDAFEAVGIDTIKDQFLIDSCNEKAGGRFLEIGCFRGTRYSDPIIDCAGSYTGIDLSPSAIQAFQNAVDRDGRWKKIDLIAGDLLEHNPSEKYDVLFAHGVLHHFESPDILFSHLNTLVKPGGLLICAEPSQVNMIFKFIRSLYRPFQSDKLWEWPFDKTTIRNLEYFFSIERGFGWGRYSMPLSLLHTVPIFGVILRPLYEWLLNREINQQLNPSIWLNSTVVLCCRSKKLD